MWRRSSKCNGASACVEVARLEDGGVALRDSKDPDGPVLIYTPSEWRAFTAGVREGEFDLAAEIAVSVSAQTDPAGGCTALDPSGWRSDGPESAVEGSGVSV